MEIIQQTMIKNCLGQDRLFRWAGRMGEYVPGNSSVIVEGAYPTACRTSRCVKELEAALEQGLVELTIITNLPVARPTGKAGCVPIPEAIQKANEKPSQADPDAVVPIHGAQPGPDLGETGEGEPDPEEDDTPEDPKSKGKPSQAAPEAVVPMPGGRTESGPEDDSALEPEVENKKGDSRWTKDEKPSTGSEATSILPEAQTLPGHEDLSIPQPKTVDIFGDGAADKDMEEAAKQEALAAGEAADQKRIQDAAADAKAEADRKKQEAVAKRKATIARKKAEAEQKKAAEGDKGGKGGKKSGGRSRKSKK